ncbi:MAG TPA: ABC transporter permease [Thermoflexales bacterium]|nr:ABC transporter permease [Thermoflexales bacterium]
MPNSRLGALIVKEFIQIVRDPRTLVLALLIPIIQLFLLGYVANNDVRNVPLAVFDQDRSPPARALLNAFKVADYFRLEYEVDSERELRALVDGNKARAALIIPPGYGERVNGAGVAEVAFILDGSDPTVASTSLAAAQLIGQAHGTALLAERLDRRGQPASIQLPLDVRTQVWYNPDLISAYFFVPGLFGVIMYAITSLLTASAIVRERERGTIEQLIVTPIRPWELVLGKLIPYAILAFLNTSEILLIGHFWFKVPIRGDLLLIALLSGLFLISSLGIGLFASTIASTQQESYLIVYATLLPTIFVSGYIFPLQAMPPALQVISYFIPLRYYLVVIRSLMIKGVGAEALQTEILALAIFGVAIMTAAALRFRKRLD